MHTYIHTYAQISDFVSDYTGLPAALWHVAYEDPNVGEEDLEEFEVQEAFKAFKESQAPAVKRVKRHATLQS